MGDMFASIASAPNGISIAEEPAHLVENPDLFENGQLKFDFDIKANCVEPTDQVLKDVTTVEKLELRPLETVDQREEIRTMAFSAYYVAYQNALHYAKNETDLTTLIDNAEDSWYLTLDGDNSTGEALAEQMFASMSTIVDQMKTLKVTGANERLGEGVAKGEQWTSEDHGRIPAAVNLIGKTSCEGDEFRQESTGLCWKRCYVGYDWQNGACVQTSQFTFDWDHAQAECDSKGLRLPTAFELASLYEGCSPNQDGLFNGCGPCNGEVECNEIFGPDTFQVWSSTSLDQNVAVKLVIASGDGVGAPKGQPRRARCVRSLNLLPGENKNLPKMTNGLKRAISLIEQHQLNFPCFARYGVHADFVTCTEIALEDELRDRVNAERTKIGNSPYSTIDQLANDRGTTVQDLHDAAEYMYAHLLLFPRENSTGGTGSAFELEFDGWTNPYIKRPLVYTTRDMDTSFLDSVGIPPLSDDMAVGKEGAQVVLDRMRTDTYEAYVMYDGGVGAPDPGIADVKDFLQETIEITEHVVGERYVEWELIRGPPTSLLNIDFYNALATVANENIEEIRAIPLGDVEGPDQFANMVCLHGPTPQSCPVQPLDLIRPTCTGYDDDDEMYPWCHWDGYVDDQTIYWLIEVKASESTDGFWKPIGVITDDPDGPSTQEGVFYIDGLVMDAMAKVTSPDPEFIEFGECEESVGLEGMCWEQGWVPAIDNEVIDPSGNVYEDSYNHYLGIAKESAAMAREMRETLIQDIINEAHDDAVEAAQFESALDTYMSGIREICGDGVEEDFEQWAYETFNFTDDGNSFYELMETKLMNEYGCEYETTDFDAEGAPRTGPVHCAVERNCTDKPTTLEDLGVLLGISSGPSQNLKTSWDLDPSVEAGDYYADVTADISSIQGTFAGSAEDIGGGISIGTVSTTAAAATMTDAAVCDGYTFSTTEEFLNPSNLWDELIPGPGFDEDVIDRLWAIRCWAMQYRSFLIGLMAAQPVDSMPLMFNEPGLNEDDFFGIGELDSLGLNYGEYFSSLTKVGASIDDLKTAATNYIGALDETIAIIDVVRDSVKSNADTTELQIAGQLSMALGGQIANEASLKTELFDCIDEADKQLGKVEGAGGDDIYSRSNLLSSLTIFSDQMGQAQNRVADWEAIHNVNGFTQYCISVASTNSVFSPVAATMCKALAEHWVGGEWDAVWGGTELSSVGDLRWYCSHEGNLDGGSRTCFIRPHGVYSSIVIVCRDDAKECNNQWKKFSGFSDFTCCCVFRGNEITDSDLTRSAIPIY